jgi:hypothetical protein
MTSWNRFASAYRVWAPAPPMFHMERKSCPVGWMPTTPRRTPLAPAVLGVHPASMRIIPGCGLFVNRNF